MVGRKAAREKRRSIEVDTPSLRKMNVISFTVQFLLISKGDLCFAGKAQQQRYATKCPFRFENSAMF
jgi:hypothetical protein